MTTHAVDSFVIAFLLNQTLLQDPPTDTKNPAFVTVDQDIPKNESACNPSEGRSPVLVGAAELGQLVETAVLQARLVASASELKAIRLFLSSLDEVHARK